MTFNGVYNRYNFNQKIIRRIIADLSIDVWLKYVQVTFCSKFLSEYFFASKIGSIKTKTLFSFTVLFSGCRLEFTQKISPHSFRHTKGMHLLQSGVSLEIIRDFLGHVDVKTTQIYARANLEMKRKALETLVSRQLLKPFRHGNKIKIY